MNRRDFLKRSGMALAASAAPSVFAETPRRFRLGFQVYAVRDLCEKDLVATLKAAKAIGYEGVETGRFYGRSAAEWKAICTDVGLELFALQLYPHNLTEPQLAETIRFCRAAGCGRINAAWYYGHPANPNDWQLVVNVLNHAAEICAKEGIRVAYHNHDHEFRLKIGRRSVWEWLWTPSDGDDLRQVCATPRFSPLVLQELDCGNCVLGGGDPVAWIGRFPGRIPCVHLTPAIADPGGLKPGEAALGSARDIADWPKILAALRLGGTEWLTVKPTCFVASLADLKASYAYLKAVATRGLAMA